VWKYYIPCKKFFVIWYFNRINFQDFRVNLFLRIERISAKKNNENASNKTFGWINFREPMILHVFATNIPFPVDIKIRSLKRIFVYLIVKLTSNHTSRLGVISPNNFWAMFVVQCQQYVPINIGLYLPFKCQCGVYSQNH